MGIYLGYNQQVSSVCTLKDDKLVSEDKRLNKMSFPKCVQDKVKVDFNAPFIVVGAYNDMCDKLILKDVKQEVVI